MLIDIKKSPPEVG